MLHQLTGTLCSVTSLRNRHLLPLLAATFQQCEARKHIIRSGHILDVARPLSPADLGSTPEGIVGDQPVQIDIPPLPPEEIQRLCREENRAVLATFLG